MLMLTDQRAAAQGHVYGSQLMCNWQRGLSVAPAHQNPKLLLRDPEWYSGLCEPIAGRANPGQMSG